MESTGSSGHCASRQDFLSQAQTMSQGPSAKQQLWTLLEANQDYLDTASNYQAGDAQTLDGLLELLGPDTEAGSKQAKLLGKISRVLESLSEPPSAAVDVASVNEDPGISLQELGFEQLSDVAAFVKEHGEKLSALNLSGFEVNDTQLAALLKQCPNLRSLTVDSSELTGSSLQFLQGKPLAQLTLSDCVSLTDEALEPLKELPLKELCLAGSDRLSDKASKALSGLALEIVDFRYCSGMGDDTLAQLKEMPLRSVAFHGCYEVTDKGLRQLEGKQLEHIDFGLCGQITDEGLKAFAGMQLKSINFNSCMELTADGIQVFKGMPLEEVNLLSCPYIEDEQAAELIASP